MAALLRTSVCLVGLFLLACGSREAAVVSIALHPSNPNIVYVATNEAVHKTRDGGATWEQFQAFTAPLSAKTEAGNGKSGWRA